MPADIGQDYGYDQERIPASIEKCRELVKGIFKDSSDIIIQVFETSLEKAMVVYVDGLINKDLLDRDVIAPLKSRDFNGDLSLTLRTHYKEAEDIQTFIGDVLLGNTALFYEKSRKVFIVDIKQWDKRSVETPDVESTIRGPKEGFTESIRTNTALLRRKIRTPKLIIESLAIGRQTNTPVGIAYVDGIVNQDVLKELRERISEIDTDAILEAGQIEQYLDENTFSPISGFGVTQRPDYVARRILEGRVAILCDGTPDVLTIPELFMENFHTGEDYYIRPVLASILRILRFLGLFITVMLPGLAVAVITYNQEMMPAVFLTSLIASTEKTPLPASAEIFFLTLMFELLKEAGTRLPKTVGSAITIVGALIIGDAAVNAGIVSAPAVIIVALTAVSSFIVPNLTEYILVYQFLFLILGSTMGLIGIGTGVVILLTQLISTSSFGIPILSSFSRQEIKDAIIRFPLGSMKYRPSAIAKDNVRRR
ncbi:MAG: spore germination protein [Bacillota bacterium]